MYMHSNKHVYRGVAPAKGRPPKGGRGSTPDHSLGAGRRQRFLTSQSPRFAHGSLREGLRSSHAHASR